MFVKQVDILELFPRGKMNCNLRGVLFIWITPILQENAVSSEYEVKQGAQLNSISSQFTICFNNKEHRETDVLCDLSVRFWQVLGFFLRSQNT